MPRPPKGSKTWNPPIIPLFPQCSNIGGFLWERPSAPSTPCARTVSRARLLYRWRFSKNICRARKPVSTSEHGRERASFRGPEFSLGVHAFSSQAVWPLGKRLAVCALHFLGWAARCFELHSLGDFGLDSKSKLPQRRILNLEFQASRNLRVATCES